MSLKKYIPSLVIALSATWLGWTVLVDFFIVPTVFREIDDFFEAGFLGIAMFSKLNQLEVMTGFVLFALTSSCFKKGRSAQVATVLAFTLLGLSLYYLTFLTPQIIRVTELWKQTDLMGSDALAGISDPQQEHQFWHGLYIGLDTIKLGLLGILMSLGIVKGETWK
jgi:hypothetical protein